MKLFIQWSYTFRFLGLANRGLGNLETAQDEHVDEPTKMQALADGNHYYAGCKIRTFVFLEFELLFCLVTEQAREKGVSISVITIKGNYLYHFPEKFIHSFARYNLFTSCDWSNGKI